ncbi:MAG TPA: YciI family protein [Candidatus Baltobacteraceae bacterium]|nr:YciI family protein [Candidatus Baltobacteraceae bacterium]
MNGDKIFAVIYGRGRKWNADIPFHEQAGVHRHRDFLADQHEAGRLIIGGPFLDDTGGLAIYRAASREDLDCVLAADATVTEELLTYEVHPYIAAFKGL